MLKYLFSELMCLWEAQTKGWKIANSCGLVLLAIECIACPILLLS